MDFYSLLELSQLNAIQAAIEPTIASIWRIKCRQYSEKFHTPLHTVMNKLDPIFVLQALYEDQYSPGVIEEELEEILEKLYRIKDPTYSSLSKEDLENLVDSVMNKEIKRLSKVKPITEEKITSEKIKVSVNKLKQGGMKFDDLEKLDSVSEENKGGFKD